MNVRLWLASAVLLGLTWDSSAAEPAQRPNILFCFADDWGRTASIYARHEDRPSPNQVVKTPHIDRVAERGVLFRRAFVNAPSCTPSRSALLSGRYFFNTERGAILQGAQWDSAILSFPLLLRDHGYFIGKTGKVWSPGAPTDAPFGAQRHAFEKLGLQYNQFSVLAGKEGLTPDQARANLATDAVKNFDQFLKARPAGQPFCYWFGPTNTHRAYRKGAGKNLWSIEGDALKGKLPAFLPDVATVREDMADYLGETQSLDVCIGALVARLKEANELDHTLIVLSGDHGPPGFPGGKCNLYDFGVQVSLMIAGPDVRGGRVVDDFVNLIDLMPTLLEVGGVKPPAGINGRSLVPLLRSDRSGQIEPERSFVVTGRERHVALAREGNLPYPQRALRTADFLYIRNFAPERYPLGDPNGPSAVAYADMDASPTKSWLMAHGKEPEWHWHFNYAFGKRPGDELYDLKRDPDQIKNVAADPAYAKTRATMSERLLAILKEAGDPRVVDQDCRFERAPFVEPRGAK